MYDIGAWLGSKTWRTSICVALLGVSTIAAAAPEQSYVVGDRFGGRILAEKGAQGVPACASCHGGPSLRTGVFPVLEGQSDTYLAKQLSDFATGRRKNPVMEPIAAGLNAKQLADVAAFYSGDVIPEVQFPSPPAVEKIRGLRLATSGNGTSKIQACANCHGVRGQGEAPSVPRIAGQPAEYLKAQLFLWRSGERANDSGQQMRAAVSGLTDGESAALAGYFSGLSVR